jgi:hypothetical protein
MREVQGQGDEPPRLNRRRIILILLCLPIFCYLGLFLPAGTFAWVRGWYFIAIFLLTETLMIIYLWRTNPALLIARSSFHRGTKRWDTLLLAILFPILMAIFPIAALEDGRFHIPSDLVVNQLPFNGESSSNLDFICLRDVSMTFCPLMSGKIRLLISIA